MLTHLLVTGNKNMNSKVIITITSMILITGLAAYALYLRIDGVVLSLIIAALAGLGGYELRGAKIEKLLKDIRNSK